MQEKRLRSAGWYDEKVENLFFAHSGAGGYQVKGRKVSKSLG